MMTFTLLPALYMFFVLLFSIDNFFNPFWYVIMLFDHQSNDILVHQLITFYCYHLHTKKLFSNIGFAQLKFSTDVDFQQSAVSRFCQFCQFYQTIMVNAIILSSFEWSINYVNVDRII